MIIIHVIIIVPARQAPCTMRICMRINLRIMLAHVAGRGVRAGSGKSAGILEIKVIQSCCIIIIIPVIPYSGYFSGSKIFVDMENFACSWKRFRS